MPAHALPPAAGQAPSCPAPAASPAVRDPGPPALPLRREIVPTEGIAARVAAALPEGSALTVTCLPHHGMEPTAETSVRLADLGYRVVPHLAARSIVDRARLARALREFASAGITEVFAVSGDAAQPAGPYADSTSLLEDIADLSGGAFAAGVAGYPEGHPQRSGPELLDALLAKQHLAASVATQMCFSAAAITDYAALLRAEGIRLPVWAGVPGAVPRARLVALAAKIGVGPSLAFITRKGPLARRLLGSGGVYSPEGLVRSLETSPAGLAGIHLFTFNSFG
ncbi:methylenetetrahydrofolate reductase [Sinomonas halotolerans]|uniref:Methylenetetrahydrofolate reductase n=1 Tax=Sinomonas halotolerans TaxID=1644133 RepID=A0ABU9WXV4_9MICC